MLIEAAFYRLSDYFQSIESPAELYESQLSFIFAVAIFQELQARGFSYLLPYIQVNRPYPKGRYNSGVCEENWVEVKFFRGAESKTSSEPKTRHLGKVLEALLRLKFYVREGGKYLLMAFNREPSYYQVIIFRSGKLEKATKPSAKLARRYLKFNASDLHRHGEIRGLTDDGRLEIMNK